MIIRLRLGAGRRFRPKQGDGRGVALVAAALMTPACVMASALAFWRLLADLRLTSEFAISSGLFSHWQVWVAMAVLLHLASRRLDRYARLHPVQHPVNDHAGHADVQPDRKGPAREAPVRVVSRA